MLVKMESYIPSEYMTTDVGGKLTGSGRKKGKVPTLPIKSEWRPLGVDLMNRVKGQSLLCFKCRGTCFCMLSYADESSPTRPAPYGGLIRGWPDSVLFNMLCYAGGDQSRTNPLSTWIKKPSEKETQKRKRNHAELRGKPLNDYLYRIHGQSRKTPCHPEH